MKQHPINPNSATTLPARAARAAAVLLRMPVVEIAPRLLLGLTLLRQLPWGWFFVLLVSMAFSGAFGQTPQSAPDQTAQREQTNKPTKSAKSAKPTKSAKSAKSAKPAKTAVANGHSYAHSAAAQAFADELAQRHALDPAWLRQQLAQARYHSAVARLILPAPVGTAKNWSAYRARFVEPVRIRAGLAFWRAHASTLERAERELGVPAHIIVGILGVETLYGQHTGNFRVLDALATLAFDFPATHPRASERAALFRGELEQFLLWQQRQGSDPRLVLGSYAGAIGQPQFLPSSVVRYAIDFDGDGRIDLEHSAADAIGSVANYLKAFGWVSAMPTHYKVQFDSSKLALAELLAPDIKPSFSAEQLAQKGALVSEPGRTHNGPLALIELQNHDQAPSYFVGSENFYAITRYNWSAYYAMAVIELGQAILDARR